MTDDGAQLGGPTSPGAGSDRSGARATELLAHAKLTTSLRVVGVRPDGYHLLEAEMVSLDLADRLVVSDADDIEIEIEQPEQPGEVTGEPRRPSDRVPETRHDAIPSGPENLVARALVAVGRRAHVRLAKRIPAGAGLGGGSADAAAVLRWAGCGDLDVAARLGADVPFCLVGGRAMVRGIGEVVEPLPDEDRRFVLLLAPFGVETGAAYRAWDELGGAGPAEPRGEEAVNDLEPAAMRIEPRLAVWREAFEAVTGLPPRLAGSGSTWFVDGSLQSLGIGEPRLRVGDETGRMIDVRTVSRP